ncbi:Reticulon-domain-containing protein [Pseudomassariella vexata]|uniref:Reticulon-like protein n=1 Tax=Pseudomassariella vexata TaxID=1141098 RepID=A0A1Y2DVB7_9PEZI|nr:Reticulon-domain-containing protein [Pseudomassariella vexata]ORY63076.1 Reticulon-domain-containing protein [Pseudomassariella vexata]
MADTAPATNGSSMDSLRGNAQAAYGQIANGPVADNIKAQHAKTQNEFSTLAASRQTPATPAATGQPLTHYHSFFSELLSWNNPRASGIAYASIVSLIFAARYLDVLRYTLRLTWMALGVTVLAEVAGKTILSNGLATQLRPRKYYTIPRDTLDALIGDVHELVNFFVIEAQRIFFAENVSASTAAAIGAFLSYYLVKVVPYWGLALIATTVTFFTPLVYKSNQELIDHHLKQAGTVVSNQTEQLRQLAGKHTVQATEITKQYMGDYTSKAQQLLSGKKSTSATSPTPQESDFPAVPKQETDFPAVPKDDLKSEDEPLISA